MEWTAERIAELRSVAQGLADVEGTAATIGREVFEFVAHFSGATVVSLLDALEEAQRECVRLDVRLAAVTRERDEVLADLRSLGGVRGYP